MCTGCPDEIDQDHYKLNEDTGYCTAEFCFVCVRDKDCFQRPPATKPDIHFIDMDRQPHIGETVTANCGEQIVFCNPIDIEFPDNDAKLCDTCWENHQKMRRENKLPRNRFVHRGQ